MYMKVCMYFTQCLPMFECMHAIVCIHATGMRKHLTMHSQTHSHALTLLPGLLSVHTYCLIIMCMIAGKLSLSNQGKGGDATGADALSSDEDDSESSSSGSL